MICKIPVYEKTKLNGLKYPIGVQGEDKAQLIIFDCSEWLKDYGYGTAALQVIRPGDHEAYLANIEQDGAEVTWKVSSADTAFAGTSLCQLRWMTDEGNARTFIFKVTIAKSLAETDNPPTEVTQGWIDTLVAEAHSVDGKVQDFVRVAQSLLEAYDDNAERKTETFNQNAATKEAELNAIKSEADKIAKSVREDADAGEFDGKDGRDGKDGKDGLPGAPGPKGDPGETTYVENPYDDTEIRNEIGERMKRYVVRLVKEGNAFVVKDYYTGETLSFDTLKNAISDTSKYVVCVYGNSKLRPQYVSTGEMMFIGLDRASAEAKVLRMLVTPTYVQYETYPLAAKDDLDDLKDIVDSESEEIAQLRKVNKEQDRKIDTLYKLNEGITFDYQTDDEEAYSKDVLSGAIVGDLLSIGGKSVVWNQLCDNGESEKTIPQNQNLSIVSYEKKAGHDYLIIFDALTATSSPLVVVSATDNKVESTLSKVIETNANYKRFIVKTTKTATVDEKNYIYIKCETSEIKVKNVMVVDTNILPITVEEFETMFPADYYPYTEPTIVSAEPKSLDVVGRNLFNGKIDSDDNRRIAVSTGGTYESNGYGVSNYIEVEQNASYVLSSGIVSYISWYDVDKKYISGDAWSSGSTKTIPSNARYVRFDFKLESVASVQLEKGSVATPYTPYTHESIPLPQLDLKSAGTAHDYVERRTYKNMKSVDLGDLGWQMTSSYAHRVFYCNFTDATNTSNQLTGLCNIGTSNNAQTFAKNSIDNSISKCDANQQLFIRCDSYPTVADFKNAMKGIILRYEAIEGGEDYEAVVKVENVGSFDMGKTSMQYDKSVWGKNTVFSIVMSDRKSTTSIGYTLNNLYEEVYQDIIYGNNSVDMVFCPNNNILRFVNKSFDNKTVAEFKDAMNGVVFNYELATPRIYDITDQWNIEPFECETGGTITFTQDDIHLPIPNSEKYLVSLKEANA